VTAPFGLFDLPRGQLPQPPGMFALPEPPRRRGPSIFDRIGQGVNTLLGVPGGDVLSEDARRFARSQGLLGLGSSLLRSAGPSRDPVSLAQALGQAIPQGQEAAFRGGQQRRLLEQQAAAQNVATKRAQILSKFGGRTDPESLQELFFDLASIGDLEGASKVGDMLKALRDKQKTLLKVDLDDRVSLVDPLTGTEVQSFAKGAGDEKTFEKANTLRDDFFKENGSSALVARAYGRVLTAVNDPSAVGDLSLIFGFMKMIDPGSVVREGERATAENVGNIPQNVWGFYNRILGTGERLTDEVKDDFRRQAENLAREESRSLRRNVVKFRGLARRAKVNPEDVVTDYFEGLPIPPAKQPRGPIPIPIKLPPLPGLGGGANVDSLVAGLDLGPGLSEFLPDTLTSRQ
jgi:hypothetical protein